jgi:hypothetical protein
MTLQFLVAPKNEPDPFNEYLKLLLTAIVYDDAAQYKNHVLVLVVNEQSCY